MDRALAGSGGAEKRDAVTREDAALATGRDPIGKAKPDLGLVVGEAVDDGGQSH